MVRQKSRVLFRSLMSAAKSSIVLWGRSAFSYNRRARQVRDYLFLTIAWLFQIPLVQVRIRRNVAQVQ